MSVMLNEHLRLMAEKDVEIERLKDALKDKQEGLIKMAKELAQRDQKRRIVEAIKAVPRRSSTGYLSYDDILAAIDKACKED